MRRKERFFFSFSFFLSRVVFKKYWDWSCIYRDRNREMIDFGKPDKMRKISGKVDKNHWQRIMKRYFFLFVLNSKSIEIKAVEKHEHWIKPFLSQNCEYIYIDISSTKCNIQCGTVVESKNYQDWSCIYQDRNEHEWNINFYFKYEGYS